MATKRKTNPDHKCRFSYGVIASCSCGWRSANWLGKGAQANASGEWQYHLETCEKVKKEQANAVEG